MNAQAVVFLTPNQVQLRDFALREPAEGELLVESEYTCVSPGTELRRLRGRESVGGTAFPFVPGYCLAGRVVARGPNTRTELGARVLSFVSVDAGGLGLGEGGHLSHAIVPDALAIRIPPAVDSLAASISVLAGIAIHGVRMAHPNPGDRAVVIGLGVIGQMAARICAARGADTLGVDRSEFRVGILKAAGFRAMTTGADLKESVRPSFPEGADVIIDCTGTPTVLPHAMELGRRQPWDPLHDMPSVRYLILGTYEGDFTVSYAAAYAGQYTFLVPAGSQVSDCAEALGMIARGELGVRDLISDVRPPQAAPETYAELAQPENRLVTVAFKWN